MADLIVWLWFLVQFLGVLAIAAFVADHIVAPRISPCCRRDRRRADSE